MTKSKADAAKIHFIDFKDHASRPAETFWSGQKHRVLPPLPSLCFYFVHPDFNLDELDLRAFWRDVIDGLYGPFRFEMFCIPGEVTTTVLNTIARNSRLVAIYLNRSERPAGLIRIPNMQLHERLRASFPA